MHTIKEKEKILLLNRLSRWVAGEKPAEIVAKCGSLAKKKLSIYKERDGLPDVSADFVRGVVDGDGSITQLGGNCKFIVSQKDPYLLHIVHKHLNYRGKVVKVGGYYQYILEYRDNLALLDNFFKAVPY
jgi:hypothetical protein